MTSSVAVVWFRRDLRVHDHPALVRAVGEFGRVAPLFVVDTRLVGGRPGAGRAGASSPNRTWFMRESAAELSRQLAGRGAEMSILRGDPTELVPRFAAGIGARAVLVSRDYSPYGRRRDDGVARACASLGIDFISETGLLVHEPEAVRRSDGGPFSVFTPFHRAWETLGRRPVLGPPGRIRGIPTPYAVERSIEALLADVAPTADPTAIPSPGETAARARLEAWARSEAFASYAAGRDRLDHEGSSRLSQDLRWGLLSPVEVLERVGRAVAKSLVPIVPVGGHPDVPQPAGADHTDSLARFRTAMAWRDFYSQLLHHRPELASRSLRPQLEDLAWQHDERVVDAWRLGRTGVPVVDAAMRQLLSTGWMPNRARMIVASYLTKQLGVDWRVGAAHFMAHLVDGDVANNSGGWQWSASTGTDAQPWFRIFNPLLQARRFDPDGAYVRRWVPELAARDDLPGPAVHEPPHGAYLTPVVDPGEGRQRALAAYRAARDRDAAAATDERGAEAMARNALTTRRSLDPGPLADALLEIAVVPSFSRIGPAVRRRLYGWAPAPEGALSGRTALVTGPTSGIGRAAADALAALGARVVLVGRSEERLAARRAELAAACGTDRFPVVVADMGSLASVRSAVEQILATEDRLDILLDNAGAIHAERMDGPDGIEATFALLAAAPFALEAGLLPLLRTTAGSRVIGVTSGGMYTQALDLDDLEYRKGPWSGSRAYARAKRAQVVLMREWARRLRDEGVAFAAMHPGWADTRGLREALPWFHRVMRPLLRTPDEAVDTIAWLAVHPEPMSTTGRLYLDRRPRPFDRVRGTRVSSVDRRRVWEEVVDLVRIPDPVGKA